MTPAIELRRCDDWIAVYLDGRKVYENHSVTPGELLDVLKISHVDTLFEGRLTGREFPEQL